MCCPVSLKRVRRGSRRTSGSSPRSPEHEKPSKRALAAAATHVRLTGEYKRWVDRPTPAHPTLPEFRPRTRWLPKRAPVSPNFGHTGAKQAEILVWLPRPRGPRSTAPQNRPSKPSTPATACFASPSAKLGNRGQSGAIGVAVPARAGEAPNLADRVCLDDGQREAELGATLWPLACPDAAAHGLDQVAAHEQAYARAAGDGARGV